MSEIDASHADATLRDELTQALDEQWREMDRRKAAKSAVAGPSAPTAPDRPTPPPGSLLLSPEETKALDALLAHPTVRRVLAEQDLP